MGPRTRGALRVLHGPPAPCRQDALGGRGVPRPRGRDPRRRGSRGQRPLPAGPYVSAQGEADPGVGESHREGRAGEPHVPTRPLNLVTPLATESPPRPKWRTIAPVRRGMNAQQLVSLRGLSCELRIAIGWLKDEADAGRIPCLRAGRRRLFNVEAVREALLRRAAGEQPPSGNPEHGEEVAP